MSGMTLSPTPDRGECHVSAELSERLGWRQSVGNPSLKVEHQRFPFFGAGHAVAPSDLSYLPPKRRQLFVHHEWLATPTHWGLLLQLELLRRSTISNRTRNNMKKAKSFPFERARRITPAEVKGYRKAIEAKLGKKRGRRRGRPPKAASAKARSRA